MVIILKAIECDNCNKNKRLPFTLDWEYNDTHCDKCGRYKEQSIRYHFCSSNCLKEWTLKFVGHKHEWKPHSYLFGVYEDDGEWRITKTCRLCKTDKEFKATKKDIKEKQQTWKEYQNANK